MTGPPSLADLAGDPHPFLARLRARAPVARVPALGGWLVTSRAAAVDVLRAPVAFTVADERFSTARVLGPSMLSSDGADHERHRRPFVAAFRPRQVVERFEAFVNEVVEGRLDAIAAQGAAAELRSSLAGPVAAAVVAESLGLDGRDERIVAGLLGWYREIVDSVSGVAAGHPLTMAGGEAMAALGDSLRPHLGMGVAGSVLADAADRLGAEEVIANAAVIMFGGIETTEGMILNLVWHLLGPMDGRAALCSAGSAAVERAVEESLRLEPAAAVVDRYATADVTVAGADVARGDLVVVSLAGANRDPAEFPDPDRFDLDRPNLRRQLAFAIGPHVCIGMDLARLEARVTLGRLLARWPDLELDDGAPPPTGLVFRKPVQLPVHAGAGRRSLG